MKYSSGHTGRGHDTHETLEKQWLRNYYINSHIPLTITSIYYKQLYIHFNKLITSNHLEILKETTLLRL